MRKESSTWRVYIVKCRDNSLYTGITTDVNSRIARHNAGDGAKYTRIRRPVSLVYSETGYSKSDAKKREIAIKSLSRKNKEVLIKSAVSLGTKIKNRCLGTTPLEVK